MVGFIPGIQIACRPERRPISWIMTHFPRPANERCDTNTRNGHAQTQRFEYASSYMNKWKRTMDGASTLWFHDHCESFGLSDISTFRLKFFSCLLYSLFSEYTHQHLRPNRTKTKHGINEHTTRCESEVFSSVGVEYLCPDISGEQ